MAGYYCSGSATIANPTDGNITGQCFLYMGQQLYPATYVYVQFYALVKKAQVYIIFTSS